VGDRAGHGHAAAMVPVQRNSSSIGKRRICESFGEITMDKDRIAGSAKQIRAQSKKQSAKR
jgi:hypothetical protein